MVGNCDTGSSCAYTNTLSWKNADTPLAVEVNPRSVFERLFGTVDPSLAADVRARRALYRKSILDQTREDAQRLMSGARCRRPAQDGRVSHRHSRDWKRVSPRRRRIRSRRRPRSPPGIPFEYQGIREADVRSSGDRVPADLTRVSTMMLGREGSVRTYPEIGVPDPHHPLTHHRGPSGLHRKGHEDQCFHVELFAEFIAKLKATTEVTASLLDHSAILYGAR